MNCQGRRERQHLCTDAGGHRLDGRQTAPLIRLMFPEVHTHFESPRQEEHHSTPAEMRTVTLSSDVVPPVGRQDQGLSRVPFPYLDEPPWQFIKAVENSRSRLRSQLLIWEPVNFFAGRAPCGRVRVSDSRRAPAARSVRRRNAVRAGRNTVRAGGTRCVPGGTQCAPAGTQRVPGGTQCAPGGTQYAPAGTQCVPRGTQRVPGGTQCAPRGTQRVPRGTQCGPANSHGNRPTHIARPGNPRCTPG
jgi:hypothetical protein